MLIGLMLIGPVNVTLGRASEIGQGSCRALFVYISFNVYLAIKWWEAVAV